MANSEHVDATQYLLMEHRRFSVANGLFGLLVWWLNGRMRLSVEEVNEIFRRLAVPTLKAAMR